MPSRAPRLALLALAFLPTLVCADPPALPKPTPAQLLSILGGTSVDGLAGSLRGYLAHHLPPTLYDASPGWGTTKEVTRGVKWKGQGLGIHPERVRVAKNDGHWRRITLAAPHLPDSLVLDLRNVQNPEPGRVTFDLFLAFDARLTYCHQVWESGLKVYDGDFIARFRVKLLLRCELSARLESGKGFLPDAVARLRATNSKLEYDNFVTDHVGGVGGALAKLLGDLGRGGLQQWHPSLERELLAKGEAALVKAADTKEVRVGLNQLMKRKP